MQETMKLFSQGWEQEAASGKYVGLFLIALFYLWFRNKKHEPLTLFALISTLIVLNPLLFWCFTKVFPTIGDYGKFIWIIPIPLIIAYVAVDTYSYKKPAIIGFISFALIIAVSGTFLPYKADAAKWKYQKDYLERALNVVENQEEYYHQEIILLAPDDMMATARAHSENIYPLYGKDLWMKEANAEVADDYSPEIYQLYEKMKVDYTIPNEIANYAEYYGCNILVLRENITEELGPSYKKWELVEEIPGYLIYRFLIN